MNPYEEAIDVLEKHGWVQGQVHSIFDGGYCTWGALYVVSGGEIHNENHTSSYLPKLSKLIRFFTDVTNIENIANWNDHEDRKKEEVLEELRIVGKAWANEGRTL